MLESDVDKLISRINSWLEEDLGEKIGDHI